MPSVEGDDDNFPPKGFGVRGRSHEGDGVVGSANSPTKSGVYGWNSSKGYGVYASSGSGYGVVGRSNSIGTGVRGYSTNGFGV